MSLDSTRFRRVMGRFATGVSVITAPGPDGKPVGLTANALTSVSLSPPLILFCLDHGADCYASFEAADSFTVNVLGAHQEEISRRFATKGCEKFDGVGWKPAPGGGAILDGSAAFLDCRVIERHEVGDHTLYIGRVEAAEAGEEDPLLFYQGAYRKLA